MATHSSTLAWKTPRMEEFCNYSCQTRVPKLSVLLASRLMACLIKVRTISGPCNLAKHMEFTWLNQLPRVLLQVVLRPRPRKSYLWTELVEKCQIKQMLINYFFSPGLLRVLISKMFIHTEFPRFKDFLNYMVVCFCCVLVGICIYMARKHTLLTQTFSSIF